VRWSIVMKEKTTFGSPFYVVFPSDRITKSTTDVNFDLFIHSSHSFKLHQQIPGTF
jgi:hypothetical protein